MKPEQERSMKTEFLAWAVQVLRDGEWGIEHLVFRTRSEAMARAATLWAKCRRCRVRKARVTVEEV